MDNRELQADVKRAPLWEGSREWPRWVAVKIVWEKGEIADTERYAGPSMNLASVEDFNRDGKEDLVFTNPDMYCIASGDTDRLRVCANDQCRWIFYDSSRTGRRRWCDMATCGNRAKAARHRARQRESAPAVEA